MSSPRAQFTMRMPGFMMAMDCLVDEAFGLRGEADVEREVVGALEDVVDRDEGDLVFAGDDRGDEGIVADDLHPKGAGAAGDLEADATEADDAEGFAAQLGALERLLCPTCRRAWCCWRTGR